MTKSQMQKQIEKDEQQTFPKIKTEAKLTELKKKKDCCDFKLIEAEITGSQFEKISDIIDEADPVFVTIQKKQGTLPGTM